MVGRLEGKTALVTGGSAGIGRAFAQRLASDGARIVVADLDDAAETLQLVDEAGSTGVGFTCDVASPDSVAELGRRVRDEIGSVDILVNNAGIYPVTPFAEMTFDDWRRVMSINLDSMFLTCHEFVPDMRERGWGRVVCLTSTSFYAGTPTLSHYAASKGGIIGFVRSLAAELGDEGITVNAVAPSLVRSPGSLAGGYEELGFFDQVASSQAIHRTQEPRDLVGALSFLASDDAAFITGQTLVVDGGYVHT